MSFPLSSEQAANPAAADGAGPVRVNKRELAVVLGVSVPTVDAYLLRFTDFPVVRRGAPGVEWQFDAAACVDFMRAQRDAEHQAEAARQDAAAQLAMPVDVIVPAEDRALDPAKRLQIARARAVERELAMKAGLLVPTSEVRQVLGTAFAALGRDLQAYVRQLGADHAWTDLQQRDADARMAETLHGFRRSAERLLADPGEGDHGQLRLA